MRKHGESAELEASGRPFWSGTISFGLVSIPVNLFPANRDSKVSLRMLGPDGTPLKRDYFSAESGKDLEDSETSRGFETSTGKVVTVTDEELERLAPEKTRTIDLRLFVPHEEISPLYFNRAYFLTPADKSAKAYRLLAETMERKKRVGIATFVMRAKEYLVAIISEGHPARRNAPVCRRDSQTCRHRTAEERESNCGGRAQVRDSDDTSPQELTRPERNARRVCRSHAQAHQAESIPQKRRGRISI